MPTRKKLKLKYGNQDINDLITFFKQELKLDRTSDKAKWLRIFAWLIIRDYGFWLACRAIIASKNDEFWATNLTSLRHLYKNICPRMKRHYLYELPAQERFKGLKQKYQIGKQL